MISCARIGSAIRGTGDTSWVLYSQIFGTIYVLGVSYLLAVVFGFGLLGVFLTIASDELIRGIINYIKFKHYSVRSRRLVGAET